MVVVVCVCVCVGGGVQMGMAIFHFKCELGDEFLFFKKF